MQPHTQPLKINPAYMATMTIDELMDVTLRLADLLIEESEHLAAMRVKDIEPLQAEKRDLTNRMELYQMRIKSDPSFVTNAPAHKREELLLLSDDLTFAVEENFRCASVARAVNGRVMQAIRDALTEKQHVGVYDRKGYSGLGDHLAVSMNLNQKA